MSHLHASCVRRYCRRVNIVLLVLGLTACASLGTSEIPLDQLKARYANAQSHYLDLSDGVQLHYRDEGQGPVVILLHGVMASLQTWDGWAETLTKHYRVIRVDLPGFGLTGPSSAIDYYDTPAMVTLLDTIRTQLVKDEPVFLVGNSLGGYLAWNYAAVHPEKVRGLIVIDPVSYPQDTPWIISLIGTPVIGAPGRWIAPRFMVDMNVREVYGDPTRITEATYDRYFELLMRSGNRDAMVDIFHVLKQRSEDPHLGDGINKITVPTQVMWGGKDAWIPPEFAARWQRDVPAAEVITYDDAGHVPMEEIPQRTVADAMRFMQSVVDGGR
jgi:pimeloyl-ACP methyl ester carboxylesterase